MGLYDDVMRLQIGEPHVDMMNWPGSIIGTISRDISLIASNPAFAGVAAFFAGRRRATQAQRFRIIARDILGRDLLDDELFCHLIQTFDVVVSVGAKEFRQPPFARPLRIEVDARPRPRSKASRGHESDRKQQRAHDHKSRGLIGSFAEGCLYP